MQSLRYVVLHHEGFGEPHFDLMFETSQGSSLITWRSLNWPVAAGDGLTRIGDHRRDYLDFEGPLTGNRGHVRRVLSGTCVVTASAQQVTVEMAKPAHLLMILKMLDGDRWQVVEVDE